MSGTISNNLDQQKFGGIVTTAVWVLVLPLFVATFLVMEYVHPLIGSAMEGQPQPLVLGLPLVVIGVGEVGFIAFGPQSFGVISIFGAGLISLGGVGIVSFGGVAVGAVAIGGAACGLIAVGGAALGYVAVGGGACGIYVMAGGGKGRHVLDSRRQDPEAIRFFCKYVPRLRAAFTA
jgi:hypothetical protein